MSRSNDKNCLQVKISSTEDRRLRPLKLVLFTMQQTFWTVRLATDDVTLQSILLVCFIIAHCLTYVIADVFLAQILQVNFGTVNSSVRTEDASGGAIYVNVTSLNRERPPVYATASEQYQDLYNNFMVCFLQTSTFISYLVSSQYYKAIS